MKAAKKRSKTNHIAQGAAEGLAFKHYCASTWEGAAFGHTCIGEAGELSLEVTFKFDKLGLDFDVVEQRLVLVSTPWWAGKRLGTGDVLTKLESEAVPCVDSPRALADLRIQLGRDGPRPLHDALGREAPLVARRLQLQTQGVDQRLRVARAEPRQEAVERRLRRRVRGADARDELRQHAEPGVEGRAADAAPVALVRQQLRLDLGLAREAEPQVQQIQQILLHRRRPAPPPERDGPHEAARRRHQRPLHGRRPQRVHGGVALGPLDRRLAVRARGPRRALHGPIVHERPGVPGLVGRRI